ncbi:hypothetical protein KIN20_017083 [Parelaphostrongylus tenuis]|uniref:Uncharacterized protein n=1 Tax=Parelaphostrongylus tenuis TaxID=148309 RepID=A0AAD5MZG7_PARTN|nr:hypothetical protein KIN20_017083 [Parelaphostrongylus tenuis]
MHLINFSVRLAIVAGGETPFFDLTRYHDFSEFEDYIRSVARTNPNIVQLRLIGYSHERRPLLGLKTHQFHLKTPSKTSERPASSMRFTAIKGRIPSNTH